MGIDKPEDDEAPRRAPDALTHGKDTRGPVDDAADLPSRQPADQTPANPDTERRLRISRVHAYRAKVEQAGRSYAVDQAYDKIRETEESTVTPAMHRIESADPTRHLAGLENRLKGKDRLTEKVESNLQSNADLSPEQAVAKVKDAIRYTFVYDENQYAEGVQADIQRLGHGFELLDLRNSWAVAEYKGFNTRWRDPASNQVFEVQFHTQASLDAKELTHRAYEKIRDPATSKTERDELQKYQRQVSAGIPVPPGADDIKDYP